MDRFMNLIDAKENENELQKSSITEKKVDAISQNYFSDMSV